MTLEILYAFSVAPGNLACVPLMGLSVSELTFSGPCSHELVQFCVFVELVYEGYQGRTVLDEPRACRRVRDIPHLDLGYV